MALTQADRDEIASLIAQQIGQQAAQLAAQQSTQGAGTIGQAGTGGVSTVEARAEDVAGGERLTKENVGESSFMFANNKIHLDQHFRGILGLENDIRQSLRIAEEDSRMYMAELRQDARKAMGRLEGYKEALLRSTVATGHLADLQAISHRDIAIDSEWVPGPGEETVQTGGPDEGSKSG